MNGIYGIICGKCTPGLQLEFKGNKDYLTKSNIFDSLWLTKETNKITAGIDVKLNDSASLYNCIQGYINMRQGKTEPNDTFKLLFGNIYETTEIAWGDNILHIKQLTKNGSHE